MKKAQVKAQIAGIGLNSASKERVLSKIIDRIKKKKKTFVVTPNPEFMVYAQKNPWFRKILNQADLAVPDGIGLVWAGRVLGQPIKRVAGADLVAELLDLAQKKGWSVGVMGPRGGVKEERKKQMKKLQIKYPQTKIISLEETPDWKDQPIELVFACQGMGRQEKWILENLGRSKGLVFMGIGGSLDFLTGFVRRAPVWMRRMGLEWLWRGWQRPAHFRRIWRAVVKFNWLILKEKFLINFRGL